MSRRRTIESRNEAYRGGTRGSWVLGHRRVKSWCISGMPRMWRRRLHPKQPTGCNSSPTRIEEYVRGSRATLRQGFTNTPTSDGISRVTGKGVQERRLQFKNSGWAAYTRTITGRRNVSFGRRPAADFGFHRTDARYTRTTQGGSACALTQSF